MRAKRASCLLIVVLGSLALFPAPPAGALKPTCIEAILVWSWEHMDWICSDNDGGGAVCTLCSD